MASQFLDPSVISQIIAGNPDALNQAQASPDPYQSLSAALSALGAGLSSRQSFGQAAAGANQAFQQTQRQQQQQAQQDQQQAFTNTLSALNYGQEVGKNQADADYKAAEGRNKDAAAEVARGGLQLAQDQAKQGKVVGQDDYGNIFIMGSDGTLGTYNSFTQQFTKAGASGGTVGASGGPQATTPAPTSGSAPGVSPAASGSPMASILSSPGFQAALAMKRAMAGSTASLSHPAQAGQVYTAPDGTMFQASYLPLQGKTAFQNLTTGDTTDHLPAGAALAYQSGAGATNNLSAKDYNAALKNTGNLLAQREQTETLQQLALNPAAGIGNRLDERLTRGLVGMTGIPWGDVDPASLGTASALFKQLGLSSGAAFFKGQGAVSDYERKLASQAMASIDTNPKALQFLLDVRRRGIQREIDATASYQGADPSTRGSFAEYQAKVYRDAADKDQQYYQQTYGDLLGGGKSPGASPPGKTPDDFADIPNLINKYTK
ncbi:hypothetical protein [Nitrospirillum iridis]|uniref:Uncharacterized protein n=1 Tax=Nitrospirillum iridis TaxID=765888 RepID=A0A7X0EFG3_9PROT|nr:hypothetical protein [Nitrospirillum iridis]MBB6253021.1 hypothetical protein [Nitrospirillum iridis]